MSVFRKLIPKVKSRSTNQVPSAAAEPTTQTGETTFELRRAPRVVPSKVYYHGLFILYPAQEIPNSQQHHSVDIVAVHGLNGKARGTWTDKETGMLWLEDFLPAEMPDARIMTFGYDSGLMFSQSKGRIEDFARDLLNRLWMLRQSPQEKSRPLIFVCHSLGGIVVKKALVLAHELNHHYQDILTSTTGIVFMGTPHRGADIVNWTSFLTNAIKAVSGNQIVRTDLVKELNTHSSTLLEISKSFLPRSSSLAIMSFIETLIEPRLNALVVSIDSSQLGLPNEMVFPVNAHHRSICRYPSAEDQTYILVKASIKSIASGHGNSLSFTAAEEIKKQALVAPAQVQRTTNGTAIVDPSESSSSSALVQTSDAQISTILRPRVRNADYNSTKENERVLFLANANFDSEKITIKISGLRKKISATNRGYDTYTEILHIPEDTHFSELQQILKMQAPGFIIPQSLQFKSCSYPISSEWIDCFTLPVRVTNGQPCYKSSLGYQINARQSIAAFFRKVFPYSMEAKICTSPKLTRDGTKLSHSVMVGKVGAPALQISLVRTVRIRSGNATVYRVPRELGTFPLFNTQTYKDRLPSQAASQGGLFFPMYEKEAMYLTFDCSSNNKYAVRPFLGGINAISGESLTADHSNSPRKQDYIIIPEQKRLDGIAVQPGIVKQFVAVMPNPESKEDQESQAPSNNTALAVGLEPVKREGTIEWQMTGKDEIGGIQLQIIPQFKRKRMFAGSMKDACPRRYGDRLESYMPIPDDVNNYDVLKTPEELGLKAGDTIHIRNLGLKRERDRPKRLMDLKLEMPNSSDVLELEALSSLASEIVLSVRGPGSGHDAVLFRSNVHEQFEDIQKAAQEIFQLPEGILHISGRVDNNPYLRLPVTSWTHLAVLTQPAEIWNGKAHWSKDGCHVVNFDSGYSDTDVGLLHIGPKVELILLRRIQKRPRIQKRVCRVVFLNKNTAESDNPAKPLLFELPNNATVGSLRKLLERTTKESTSVYRVTSVKCSDLPDDTRIFDQSNIPEFYSIPVLAFSSSIRIRVEIDTSKRIINTYVWPEELIGNIIKLVQRKEGPPPQKQLVLYDGAILWDRGTFSLYGLKGTVDLEVVPVRSGGGPNDAMCTTVTLGGIEILKSQTLTIASLKAEIFQTLGIFVHRQQFDLPDDYTLDKKPLTLELKIRPYEPVALGVGAGGNIMQEIIEDKSNPAIWDVGSSKILNIHIINSHDFKVITGLSPPVAPIPWEMYSLLGFLRDKPWGEKTSKVKGVSSNGAFDNLVGLGEEDEDGDKEEKEEKEEEEEEYEEEKEDDDDYSLNLFDKYASDDGCDLPVALLEADQTVPWFHGLGPEE
ncbi:hypothetical protein GGI35DRAFT_430805 [Trichoderma velutinum]